MDRPNQVARTGYVERRGERGVLSALEQGQARFSMERPRMVWDRPAPSTMVIEQFRLSPRAPASADSKAGAWGGGRETTRGDGAAVIAYTDGACSGNPGPGGWAWAVSGGLFATGAEQHTTNQRMEVTAAFQAVLSHSGPIEVVSDSTYVVNCFKQRWWEGWLKRGWTNSQRRPVANRDLWEPFIELVRARGNVTFRWVKGHSEDRMNQFVDLLAVEASQTQTPRSGRCP